MSGGGVTPSPTPDPPEPTYDFAINIFVREYKPTGDWFLVNANGNALVGEYTTKEWVAFCPDGSNYDDQIISFISAADADEEFKEKWSRITTEWGAQTSYNPISVTDSGRGDGSVTVNGETVTVDNNVASKVFRVYE